MSERLDGKFRNASTITRINEVGVQFHAMLFEVLRDGYATLVVLDVTRDQDIFAFACALTKISRLECREKVAPVATKNDTALGSGLIKTLGGLPVNGDVIGLNGSIELFRRPLDTAKTLRRPVFRVQKFVPVAQLLRKSQCDNKTEFLGKQLFKCRDLTHFPELLMVHEELFRGFGEFIACAFRRNGEAVETSR